MPRSTATPTDKKPVDKKITLSKKQFEILEEISESITDARLTIGRFDATTLSEAGFTVGKLYARIDRIEDQISDLIREIDPDYENEENY